MKSNAIIALLLCIVASSETAFTRVQPELADTEPESATTARPASNYAHVSEGLLVPRTPAVPTVTTPSSTDDLVVVAMPFSSLQLSPALVEYLSLTRTQAKAIQKLMDQQRPTTEPLTDELRTVSAELGVAVRHNPSNDNKGAAQSLAATQAQLLKQLMGANSRLQRRIDDVLAQQQRKKLDALRHKADLSVVQGS